jgi:excisionase family DNA binding protein
MATEEINVIAPGWLTTQQAAVLADYTEAYIRQLAIAGRIKAQKLGRDWLINKEDLLAYKARVRPGRPRGRGERG